ncbi:uncharacterized protein B0H18DRAFT_960049 [Fomitopsis serialis]|uniref:uncharacterized protein n=1 Tax=Fomitopsis serialis TaxID=139415 RepID=UPI0020088E52|nr:uncharacterized protein B0H18DRAFT_960049 [Neoantrodia serialis]KAH9914045.1 hypothetical protein B0H18DRAFT_960049 [Neoantrodia serialis]
MPSLSFNGDIVLLSALYYPSDELLERTIPVVTTFEGGRTWVDVERIMTRDFQIFSRTIAVRDDQNKLHRFKLFWQTQTHDRHPRALRINEPAKAVVPGHTFRGDLLIMRIGVRRPYTHLTDSGEKAFARAALRSMTPTRFLDTATRITEMRQANNSDIRTIMPADLDGHSDDLQPVMLHATALNAHGVHHPAAAAPPSQPRRRSPSEARPERRDPPAGGSKHGGLAREDVRQVDIGDARRLSAKRWQDVAFMRSPVQGVDHLVSRPRIWTGQSQLRGNRSKVGESRSRWSGTVGGAMPGCEEEKTPYHVLAAPNALAKATLRAKISELQPTPRPPIRRPRLAPVVRFGFDHALMTGRSNGPIHVKVAIATVTTSVTTVRLAHLALWCVGRSGRRTMEDLCHKRAQKNQGLPDILSLYVDFTATRSWTYRTADCPDRTAAGSPTKALGAGIAPCATKVDWIAKPAASAAANDPVDSHPTVFEAGGGVSPLILPGPGPESQADIDAFLRPLGRTMRCSSVSKTCARWIKKQEGSRSVLRAVDRSESQRLKGEQMYHDRRSRM